jgi:hypothetical protein
LRDELPEVAAVFATGVIDIRMVLTIIARIENVEDEVMPRLDAALARHAPKWIRGLLDGQQSMHVGVVLTVKWIGAGRRWSSERLCAAAPGYPDVEQQ